MSIDGTSNIVASITAILSVGLLAFAGAGCDKSSSDGDKAEAESPEEQSESADSGSTGDKQAKSEMKQQGSAGKKMKQRPGRKMKRKAPDIEVTEKDLENFAKVQMRMKDYAKKEGLKDKKPQGKKEKIKMMMKMKQKASSVMDDIGMDKKRYAKIGRKMRSDPELQKRLDKKIQSMQGSESEGSGGESDASSGSGK